MDQLKNILENTKHNATHFGYVAANINQADLTDYEIPDLIRDEIPTLNKFGYMKIWLDEYSQKFIDYSASSNAPCLELGTAYGFVAIKALEQGAKIIANDISYEHLSILLKSIPKQYLENLYIYPGKFPQDIDLPESSLTAVLTARMLHFLDEKDIEIGLNKIHSWLREDGKLYFISVSPYHANIREQCLPIYQKKQKEGELWPGKIENQWDINPLHEAFVPKFLHVFDTYQLEKLLPKFGFEIEQISLFDYLNDTDSEGKGHVGLVARKTVISK